MFWIISIENHKLNETVYHYDKQGHRDQNQFDSLFLYKFSIYRTLILGLFYIYPEFIGIKKVKTILTLTSMLDSYKNHTKQIIFGPFRN